MAMVETYDFGTPKRIARAEVVTAGNPASTANVVVDCSAYVPKGTKAVEGWFQCDSTAINHDLAIREHDSSVSLDTIRTQVANVAIMGHFLVKLNATYEFDYAATNAAINNVYIRIWIVYL